MMRPARTSSDGLEAAIMGALFGKWARGDRRRSSDERTRGFPALQGKGEALQALLAKKMPRKGRKGHTKITCP